MTLENFMHHILQFPHPFVKNTKKPLIPLYCLNADDYPAWVKKQSKSMQAQLKLRDFTAKPKQVCKIIGAKGDLEAFVFGLSNPVQTLDSAVLATAIQNNFEKDFLAKNIFEIKTVHQEDDAHKLCLGWGLAAYKFTPYKQDNAVTPTLLWPAEAHDKAVTADLEAASMLRNLINTPANDLGTDELADIAKQLSKTHKAKIKIIKDEELIKKNFPMIYTVGQASPRRPQLVDITWGKKSDPKVTIVGKGIIYDTGGLNLKPGQFMRSMKKDMGGAAHALGVASIIMSLDLPIQLRVLIPIAENAVAGNSYRPGDILQSRKGLTVEVDDTDAEGRLVVADTLTYACEDDPDLLVDFCTLTGAARVAVGYDIPAFFSNRDEIADSLRDSSKNVDDFMWPFPLWEGYDGNINGSISDLISVGSGRAGHIEAALFLQRFITDKTDWIHLDCFAWEQNGKPGRPKGGAETGLFAIADYIKTRYS
jgi:leucyl aminopeptidase